MFSKQMVKPHNKEITHACNYFSTNNACPFASPHKDDQYHGKKQYGISSSCVSCLLTHWGRVKHICVSKVKLIGSDNGLSPGLHQVIIWTNAAILLMWPLGTKFSGMLIEIHTFSFKKTHLKMSSAKWRQLCLHPDASNPTDGHLTWLPSTSPPSLWSAHYSHLIFSKCVKGRSWYTCDLDDLGTPHFISGSRTQTTSTKKVNRSVQDPQHIKRIHLVGHFYIPTHKPAKIPSMHFICQK